MDLLPRRRQCLLAIAREIVVAHGGTIGCTSVEGEGSDFHFVLPVESQG